MWSNANFVQKYEGFVDISTIFVTEIPSEKSLGCFENETLSHPLGICQASRFWAGEIPGVGSLVVYSSEHGLRAPCCSWAVGDFGNLCKTLLQVEPGGSCISFMGFWHLLNITEILPSSYTYALMGRRWGWWCITWEMRNQKWEICSYPFSLIEVMYYFCKNLRNQNPTFKGILVIIQMLMMLCQVEKDTNYVYGLPL